MKSHHVARASIYLTKTSLAELMKIMHKISLFVVEILFLAVNERRTPIIFAF